MAGGVLGDGVGVGVPGLVPGLVRRPPPRRAECSCRVGPNPFGRVEFMGRAMCEAVCIGGVDVTKVAMVGVGVMVLSEAVGLATALASPSSPGLLLLNQMYTPVMMAARNTQAKKRMTQ
jgi:hypothetical protein